MTKEKINPKFVRVQAPARLHLGFLDMHGGLDRKFGSLGLAINCIETTLTAECADDINISGPGADRANDFAEQILSHYGINGGVKIRIESAIPAHSGLGSGTQLSLAVATAIARLYGLAVDVEKQAAIMHRGARSGIGIGTFIHGGFIVDAGRGKNTAVPPVVSRVHVPEHWRIVLIFDNGAEGVNGILERHAFNTMPLFDEGVTGLLCRLTIMQILPALAEDDCTQFGAAITTIQHIIGDYFAQAQGGRYASPFMEKILCQFSQLGATGCGQSSWGPTGFAFFSNETSAFQALKKVRDDWRFEPRLSFMLTSPRNMEAMITEDTHSPELGFGWNKAQETITNFGKR